MNSFVWRLKTFVPVMSGRHEVGRELDAPGRDAEHVAQRPHEERLRDAGHALDERMLAREERDQGEVDGRFLADDDLGDLAARGREDGGE